MIAHLPLDEMSVDEKLQAMESLWEDLCSRTEGLTSPSWHGELLTEREAALASGGEAIEDWEVAKKAIRETLS